MGCAACGASNPAGSMFCNQCGTRLDGARPGPEREPRAYMPALLAEKMARSRAALAGERKQVTVLFADVQGSMGLSEGVDPEVWRRIMDGFFAILCDGVHRFEGTVNKFTGDGIMALFGAPIAHEDHAARACYAVLALREELEQYAAELRRSEGLSFSVRMGLNSGEVVVGSVGDDEHLEYTAIGHTVGLASRMEQLAAPGSAYLTESTAGLVAGLFALEPLGPFEIKGVAEPVHVHELHGIGSLRSRFEVAGARGFSSFVGRSNELQALEQALEDSIAGRGRVVAVSGDPGVGKSRLCHELAERCRARGLEVYSGHAVAHGRNIPFLPVLEMLRGWFGIELADSDNTTREKIAGRLLLLEPGFSDDLPLLFDFLGVPDPARPAPRMDREARQRALLHATGRIVKSRSNRFPGVLLLEDLHWLDPGSAVFLEALVNIVPQTRTLLVANFRPEYRADWLERDTTTLLALAPLGGEASDELLAELLGDHPSLDGLAAAVRERTEGNPFFIEEVVRGLVESGALVGARGAHRLARPVDDVAIPATVRAVLAARIDRLDEEAKSVLQTASVIGRTFGRRVLERVAESDPPALDRALDRLIDAELVYADSLYPDARYVFKHPLTQEVAHNSQLSGRRAQAHRAVAGALADLEPDRVDEQAALIAHHFDEAGDALPAARWHSRAAVWTARTHPGEALAHSRRARELVGAAPASEEAAGLATLACIGILQDGWRLGMAAEELDRTFADGVELCERWDNDWALAALNSSYAAGIGMAGRVTEALEHAQAAAAIASRVGDEELRATTDCALGYFLEMTGDIPRALELIEDVYERTRGRHDIGVHLIGFGAHAWAAMYRSINLIGMMGRLREGAAAQEDAVALAGRLGERETLGWALQSRGFYAYWSGETAGAVESCRRSIAVAEATGSTFSMTSARIGLGYAHLAAGEYEEALAALEHALYGARTARTGLQYEASMLLGLAEARLGLGDHVTALEHCRRGVAIAAQHGSYRAHSQLTLARALLAADNSGEEVEAALRAAADLVGRRGPPTLAPRVDEVRAELACARGDAAAEATHLRAARDGYLRIGADGHARRIEHQLTTRAAA